MKKTFSLQLNRNTSKRETGLCYRLTSFLETIFETEEIPIILKIETTKKTIKVDLTKLHKF